MLHVYRCGKYVTFVIQFTQGLDVIAAPDDPGAVNTIAAMIVICSMVGVARAWELIGGPQIGITQEVTALVKTHGTQEDESEAETPSSGSGP